MYWDVLGCIGMFYACIRSLLDVLTSQYIMDVFRMYWDVLGSIEMYSTPNLRCIEMYKHITQESKYLIQYIAIHLWIHHNTSDNIYQYIYDVLGCIQLSMHDQYTTITCSIHLQYISNTPYLHQTSVWNTSINRCVIHSQYTPDTFEIQSKYIT